jgi:hypothetical protein
LHASKAAVSEYVGSVGIHGHHVVTAAAEFLEERNTEIAGLPGDPDHRNAFLSQEVVDYFERDTLGGHAPSKKEFLCA